MKQLIYCITFLAFTMAISQNNNINELPFIEVVGTAEQEVVPDQIHIEITLSEKIVNRRNYTIIEQENNLKAKLNALGISLDQLTLSDSNSIILRNKRRDTGVKLIKEFILLVHTSEEVSNVFKALNEININEASILKTEHSKITDIRKEVRINAIKAAKEKASYLLEAIDEELGLPIKIEEITQNGYSNLRSNMAVSQSVNASLNLAGANNMNIAFRPIKVKFSYYIKYAIKQ